jgi:hypothetical protein
VCLLERNGNLSCSYSGCLNSFSRVHSFNSAGRSQINLLNCLPCGISVTPFHEWVRHKVAVLTHIPYLPTSEKFLRMQVVTTQTFTTPLFMLMVKPRSKRTRGESNFTRNLRERVWASRLQRQKEKL